MRVRKNARYSARRDRTLRLTARTVEVIKINNETKSHARTHVFVNAWLASLKNISNFTVQMIEKVDVGGAAAEAFVFDEVVLHERLDRVALLHDEQLNATTDVCERRSGRVRLPSCRRFARCESFVRALERFAKWDYQAR